MTFLAVSLFTATLVAAQQFEVVRKQPFWLDQQGSLRIESSRVCFLSNGDDEPRCWDYADIQHLDRLSPTELVLLSYEDIVWKLGRDRRYRFEIVDGELTDALFEQMIAQIGKPVTDRVPPEPPDAERGLPAKHLKTFGGSEGSLYLSAERIVYRTDAEEQSRQWRLDRDVAAVWSSDPYRLEVHAYEGNSGAYRLPTVYKFALKKPLAPETYRRLKLRLYELDGERALAP